MVMSLLPFEMSVPHLLHAQGALGFVDKPTRDPAYFVLAGEKTSKPFGRTMQRCLVRVDAGGEK